MTAGPELPPVPGLPPPAAARAGVATVRRGSPVWRTVVTGGRIALVLLVLALVIGRLQSAMNGWQVFAAHTATSGLAVQRVLIGLASVDPSDDAAQLAGLHAILDWVSDEDRWLAAHQAESCYASLYDTWRAAIAAFRGAAQDGVIVITAGDTTLISRQMEGMAAGYQQLHAFDLATPDAAAACDGG